MTNVNANINVLINTSQASTQLRQLTNQINTLNRSVGATNSAAAAQQAALNRALMDGANASRMFNARMVPVTDSVGRFTNSLEKNKLSLGEYTRYASSQLPGMRRVFANEWQTMERVATERVKKIQSQYVALGKSATGMQQAMQMTPTGLGKGFSTNMAIAAQKQMIFNKLIDDGSTKMLNWGKNTQWAGRQLMVGFSLPLAALGAIAAKTFMELDKATLSLERVYGDLNTSTAEVEKNSAAIQNLGREYTKYGIAVKDTIGVAARAAATGATNEDLMAVTEETLRFATLGQIEYQQALDTTISMQTAFGIASEDLANKVDFLNAVENQTILTIEDMSLAIPRVAPVIKGLGGDVEDLAVLMTALREGGVAAEQGANALKSGLASLINPTKAAREQFGKMGIDIQSIIGNNKNDLMGMLQDFSAALSGLGQFEQQQTLEKVFGKFQYARMSALFKNLASDSGQAARAMDLASMSAEELGAMSEKELSKIADTTTIKFQAAMENLKMAIAPLGEAFLKGVMPVMEGLTKIAEAFNNLPDGVKNAIAVVTGVVAGLGPVFLMTIGLVGNGIANLIKGVQFFRKSLARIRGDASAFTHLADAELDAAAAASSLEGKTSNLTSKLLLQQGAVAELITLYGRLAGSMMAVPAAVAGAGAGRSRSIVSTRGGGSKVTYGGLPMATGGVVPGIGNKDTVPAMLTPGETVVTKEASQRYAPVIAAMNAGTLPGYNGGLNPPMPSGKMDVGARYGAFIENKSTLAAVVKRFTQAELAADGSLERLERSMRELISEGVNPTASAVDAAVRRIKKSERDAAAAASSAARAQAQPIPSGRSGGQQLQIPNDRMISAGHASGQVLSPTSMWQSRVAANPQAFTAAFKNEIAMAIEQGEQHVKLYNSSVYKMFQELNEKMKNGQATIDMVKEQIGNPEAQIMLRRQLEALNLSEDEIQAKLIQFTSRLNAQLDVAAAQLGGDAILPAAQMDKVLRTATVKAGTGTFGRGSAERAAFNQMMQPSTVLARDPNDPTKKPSRRSMYLSGQGPESYKAVDFNYGKQATQISPASLAQLKVSGEQLKTMFLSMPDAAQRAAVMAGNNLAALVPIFEANADMAGVKWGESFVQSSAAAAAKQPRAALAAGGRNSPAAIFGTTGTQEGRLWGDSFSNALKAAILDGGPIPPIPGLTPAAATQAGRTTADSYNKALRAAILKGAPIPALPAAMPSLPTGVLKSTKGAGNANARMQAAGMDEVQRARMLRKYGGRLDERSGARQVVDSGRASASNLGNAMRAANQVDRTLERGVRNFGKTVSAALKTAGRQTSDAAKKATDSFKQASAKEAERQSRRRTYGDIPAGGRRGTDNAFSRQGRGGASVPTLPYVPRGFGKILDDEAKKLKAGFSSARQSSQGFGKSMSAIGKVAAQDIRSGFGGIKTQVTLAKESLGKSFASANQGIKNGGSMLTTSFREAAAKLKTSVAGGAGGAGGIGGIFRKGKDGEPSRMGRGAMGAGMALSMGSMVPMMMQDDKGKFAGVDANTASMGMMGGGMLLSMVGMIPGPILALVAAAGAAGLAFKMFRDNMDKTAIAMAKLGANIGGAANAANNMAKMMGVQSPAQRQKQMQMGLSEADLASEQYGEFQNMLESESGQSFINELKNATAPERFQKLQTYLQTAIATGLMDSKQAELFGKTVAMSMNDAILGSAVPNMIKGVQQGSAEMLRMARSRDKAVSGTEAMADVKEGGLGQVSYQNTSQIIGAGLQVIGDFANAAALANEEYTSGNISFEEYRTVIEEAKSTQREYNQSMISAIKNTDDLGAVMASLDNQLTYLGLSDEEKSALTDAAAPITSFSDTFVGFLANFGEVLDPTGTLNAYSKTVGADAQHAAREQQKAMNTTAMAQAIQGGMDVGQVSAMMKEINQNPDTRAAQAFRKSQAAGQSGQEQFSLYALTSNVEQGGVAGINTEEQKSQYIDVAVKYSETGGTMEEFQTFFNTVPEEKRVDIIASFEGLTPEQQKLLTGSYATMTAGVGAKAATDIMESDQYKAALDAAKATGPKGRGGSRKELDAITASVSEAGRVFEDNAENIITFVLDEQPPNVDIAQRINELTESGKKLAGLPPDMVAALGINIENPEDIDKYGPMADDLNKLGPIVANLPEGKKELGYELMFDSNGKPKSPAQFLKDIQVMEKELKKIDKVKNPKVKKEMIFELTQTMKDASGQSIDKETFTSLYEEIEKDFGPGIVKDLPADVITKSIMMKYNAEQLREAATLVRSAGEDANASMPGAGDELIAQADTLDSMATNLEATSNETLAAAATQVSTGGTKGTGGGGGGGGKKATPFKDFKTGIVLQIKKFADAGAKLKDLMKAKYDFFNILKMSGGIDDRIRKAGLNPLLAEELMNMDPKEANKVLNQMTGKGGKLDKSGQKLQDRYMAASISGTLDEEQKRRQAARNQQRVTRNLSSRGVSGEAISEITGDPKKTAEYIALFDKAASGSKKAKKALDDYIASIEKSTIKEQAAASATEKAIEFAERRRKISFIGAARGQGVEQNLIEYIGGDAGLMAQYTDAVKKGDVAVQKFFTEARKQQKQMQQEAYAMNPFEFITKQAEEQLDAIKSQFGPDQLRLEDESAAAFQGQFGITKDAAQDIIDKNNILISQYDQQISQYEDMNAQEQRLVQEHEREKKQWQDKIDAAQEYINGWQKSIDSLNKEISQRNHQADLLNHELDLIGKAEEDINKTYDKRMQALDEVESINNRILQSQRSQLDISRALSTGDVYAAAAAAQQMQDQQAQQAMVDARDALTTARDNQVNGLRGESGMTRTQIEEQLWQINQQNYQTGLLIYDLEDKIWQKNQETLVWKTEIDKIDKSIEEHTDKIWKNNGEILRIQKDLIGPLQSANTQWTDRLKSSDLQLSYDKDHLTYQGKTLKAYEQQNERMNAHLKQIDGARILAEGLYDTWVGVGNAIADANKTAKQNLSYAAKGEFSKITGINYKDYLDESGKFDYDAFQADVEATRKSAVQGAIDSGTASFENNYAGGFISGDGARDSVRSTLTPGEFIVRKSMVKKYGVGMFEKINQGSFSMPRYNTESPSTNVEAPSNNTNIVAPVYNTYSISVPVNQPNASADEIAYKVMTKIKSIDSSSIRRINGY